MHTDAEVISALRRAWLIPPEGTAMDSAAERKFSLDATVSDEGKWEFQLDDRDLINVAKALITAPGRSNSWHLRELSSRTVVS